MPHSRRVVVTGLGTINPLGHCVEEFWRALLACESGIRPIERFDASAFASRIGGEVPNWRDSVAKYIDQRVAKRMDRFAQFGAASAVQAVEDSGLDFDKEDRTRCGVILGSGIGGLEEIEIQFLRLLDKGPSRVSPFTVPRMMLNAATGNILLQWKLRGVNTSVVTACASATNAIGDAIRSIRSDESDVVITGGAEAALTRLGLA
ncbi:MAG TPA: beta-ketoacyl-[acyl-carrier-protein] synthase II, partial [Phycisphaerae bacterium]|nr:beta-ketoacyl-[acyl-carrier-protein] synthase II [Phycisphaerae bacterium]